MSRAPFDWAGQVTAVLAMGGLTYGAIEVGVAGFTAPRVVAAFAIAVTALGAFAAIEALAVAVFGALLAHPATFMSGLRASLLLAGGVALAAVAASSQLKEAAQGKLLKETT